MCYELWILYTVYIYICVYSIYIYIYTVHIYTTYIYIYATHTYVYIYTIHIYIHNTHIYIYIYNIYIVWINMICQYRFVLKHADSCCTERWKIWQNLRLMMKIPRSITNYWKANDKIRKGHQRQQNPNVWLMAISMISMYCLIFEQGELINWWFHISWWQLPR